MMTDEIWEREKAKRTKDEVHGRLRERNKAVCGVKEVCLRAVA